MRVGLLFGGPSVEHEVSVVSARGVAAALDPERFECIPLGVTEEGTWLPPDASKRVLEGAYARVELPGGSDDGGRVVAAPGGGLRQIGCPNGSRPVPIDVIFSVMHGWGGEDGRVQGMLELAGVPYVGAGVTGSATGMDKEIAKAVFERRGLPVAPWTSFSREDFRSSPRETAARIASELGFPLFVKPANGGSSVGVSKVKEIGGLTPAIEKALACDRKVVVEAGLDAREVECAVLGNDKPEASVLGEILPSREFYDYEAKYLDGTSRLVIPAPLDPATTAEIRSHALAAFRALDLAGMARVDFFVLRRTGRVYLNEVNTLPGFTPISMYPKLWEASGLSYAELLARLIRLALDRQASEAERSTRRDG
jgi:D-alanine-D-alanine ligase